MNKVVEVERRIPFPVGKVFAAWLQPDKFALWFLPGPGVRLGRVEVDPRVGGRFLIEMIVGPDTLPHSGVYKKIVANQEIVFTWHSGMTGDADTLVEVTFEAKGSSTVIRLRHSGLEADKSREAHAAGWANIVASLEPFLLKQESA